MEVSVTIDSAVADQLQTTLNAGSRSFLSGIILGLAQPPDPSLTDADQRSHFKVIATIPCPEEDADQPQANAKDPTRDLDDEWYAHHAQQVSRMIPGGLRVIGIYTSHANAPLPNPVYGAIHSLHLSASSHFLLLHTSKSGKLNAKALPVDQKRRCLESRSEPFVTIREADLLSTLSSISATVPFTTGVRTVIASAKAAKRCFQARTESTQRIRDGLLRSLQAFDHSQMDMILINPTSATPLPLGATLLPGSQVSVRLSLKARRFVAQIDASSDDGNESAEIFGSIHLRAYVSGDASLAQVKSALLEDLFRSVYSRLDILLDEVVDAPEEFERDEWQDLGDEMLQAFAKGGTVDLPARLELPLTVGARGQVLLSDYKSVDEPIEEVLERIAELVPVSLAAKDLIFCEVASKRMQDHDSNSKASKSDSTTGTNKTGSRSWSLYAVLALIVLLLAVATQVGLSGGKV